MDLTGMAEYMHAEVYEQILSPNQSDDFTTDTLRDLSALSATKHGGTIKNVTTAFSIVLKHTMNLGSTDRNLISMYTFSESDFPQGGFGRDKLAALQDLTTLLHRASHQLNSPRVHLGAPCTCLLFHKR